MSVGYTSTELPGELEEQSEIIAEHARREDLDFYTVLFEMLDFESISQVAAYGGFPQRYPHWRFGMEYERISKQHRYGLGKIYEMVINNDPCYAYLLNDNAFVDQKTVMAHVYAHCDFFKNNIWFSRTNRKMMDEMANHATRIRRHIDKRGLIEVESFLDTCLSLESLIDPHSMFIRRLPAATRPEEDETCIEDRIVRYPAKGYMDRYINPPDALAADRAKLEAVRDKPRTIPANPHRDILLFLLKWAPLEDWQADILAMVREESYYFAPQGQTKIMNEGWATYWHSTLMTKYILRDSELVTYADHHAGTLATSPGRLNPYKVGVELLRDIENRWNRGQYGKDYDECDDIEVRRRWGRDKDVPKNVVGKGSPGREKIFEVRKICNDITFIDNYLTPEFVEDYNLFHYRFDPATNRMVAVNRDFKRIKQQLLFSLTNHSQPFIFVVDGNYANRGELYLVHQHNGVDLQMRFATETLKNVQKLWGRPVHIQAVVDDEMLLFTYDGKESRHQKINDELPKPAHEV